MGTSHGKQGSWLPLSEKDDVPDTRLLREEQHKRERQAVINKMNAMESLDYRTFDDIPLRTYHQEANLRGKDIPRLMGKWIIYVIIGFVVGTIAWCIKKAIDLLEEQKYELVERYQRVQVLRHSTDMHEQKAAAFFVYYSMNLLYAVVACVVVLICGPLAGGSGIPEVKGYLNGVRVEGTINLKTFLGKIISLIFAFSSCLALGPEGPMVHIGSMVGGGLSGGKSKTLHIRLPKMFERLRTDREQRDFISSGTAAGIAAAFGAPIGGVLFALEETSSFWNRELTWRTFFGCMISAFTVNALFQLAAPVKGALNDYGLLSFGVSRFYLYKYQELIAFAMVGVVGGLLGAFFIKINVLLNQWRKERLQQKRHLRLLEVFVVVTVAAVLSFGMSHVGNCRPISGIQYFPNVCDQQANSSLPSHRVCQEEYYSDFANLFLVPQDKALKMLFSRSVNIFGYASLCVFFLIYFSMVTICSGLAVAGGLFVPMMISGGTYGRIIGTLLRDLFPHSVPEIDPSIYALVGSAAMMSGFSRSTISLVVIMMELTENTQFLLPIMLAVMCAKWVGDAFNKSIYEEWLEQKSIIFLDPKPPRSTSTLIANDVMARDPVCINEVESLERVLQILTETNHNGFPVVRRRNDLKQKTYRGMILRKQLLVLLDQKKYLERDKISASPGILEYETYISLLNKKWQLDMIRNLPAKQFLNDYVLDVGPYMDRSHPIVQDGSSFLDAYKTFVTLGLRHLPVVDENFQVIGIITRHDLLSHDNSKHFNERTHLI